MDCSLKRKFAKQNARNYLLVNNTIDQYNNIIDETRTRAAMVRFREHAIKEYGFKADFLNIEGNKLLFNQSAFLAVDILKGVSNANEGMDLQTQGYLTEAKKKQTLFSPSSSFDTFFDIGTPVEDIPTQGLTRLVTLKKALLDRANERASKIKAELRSSQADIPKYNKLLKTQTELRDYIDGNEVKGIEGLTNELSRLSQIDTRSPEIVGPFITKELDRLSTLVKSSDPGETKEASEIIRFIKDMAVFNYAAIQQSPTGHPLYHIKELYDDEKNFLLNDSMTTPFKQWADIATQYEDQLAAQNVRIIETVFNNNDKIKQMFGGKEFNYGDIIKSGVGLKDASWIDMMIMDISSGIFSHNSLMPQVIRNTVDNAFEKQYSWAKEIQEKIDNLTPGVVEELKAKGHSLRGLGIIGVNGVNYDLFKQMIPNSENQSSGNIAHKYSYQWFEDQSQMQDNFFRSIQEASAIDDPDMKKIKFKQAIDARNAWYKDNTMTIDPTKVAAITNDPEFRDFEQYFTASPTEIEEHEKALKDLIGDHHFNKTIESQVSKLRTYSSQRQNTLDELLASEGVTELNALTEKSQRAFQIWEAEHNPFMAVEYRNQESGTAGFRVGTNSYHSKFAYNEYVPLNNKGYYDSNYAEIEASDKLREFYDVIYQATSGMREKFPYDIQQKLLATSLPFLERNIMEILTDKDLTFNQAISKVFRQILDNIRTMIGIKAQDSFSYAKTNTNTGLPDYKINDTFISQNADKIKNLFLVNGTNFRATINSELSGSGLKKISRFTALNINAMSDKVVQSLTTKFMGKEFTRQELQTQFGDIIPIGKIIYRASQHQVAQEKSFDLPKVIKLYTHLAAQYTARQEVMPMVELMKDHYQTIKNQSTNNIGEAIKNAVRGKDKKTATNRLEGLRVNANNQIDNWFQRVVLGNMGTMKHHGVIKTEETTEDTTDNVSDLNSSKIPGKVLTKKEQLFLKEVNEALKNSDGEETTKKLLSIKNNIGKDMAMSAIIDSAMNFLRFKGLGFNLSSGITNFIEGQVANSITASSGIYFEPEHIYEVSPSDMLAGNLIKQTSHKLIPEKVAKAEYLAKAADVLQDNTNELQKASTKTAFSALKRLNPYYVMAKTEEYNQVPLMVATLKGTAITGDQGQVSNVWDALQGVYLDESHQWTAKLKPGFDTIENKESWEDFNGDQYLSWKSTIRQVIANTHGDFTETGGMMAKSSQVGKAILMFKTWLPREFYKRFAVEQDDVLSGVKGFKGRWRSHTPISMAYMGGIMGTYLFGPVGGLIGAGAGLGIGKFYGASSNLSVLQELAMTNKLLVRKLLGMPVNFVGSIVGKNHIVNTQLSNGNFIRMQGNNFTKQDFNNFRGNMQEMAMMMSWMGLLLLTKAFTWDDDDKPEDTRRQIHNLLANRFMQLASQAMMFASLSDIGKTVDTPLIKLTVDLGKLVHDFSKLMAGDDTLLTGKNAGGSATYNQAKKTFLPGIFSDPTTAGFGVQTERQFNPSPFDSYFFGPEKKAKRSIQELKVERNKDLLDQGLSEKQVKEVLKKEFPRRAKNQTYVEKEEELKNEERTPADEFEPDTPEEE